MYTNHKSAGHTLMELITAIVVASLLSTLVFKTYLFVVQTNVKQKEKRNRVVQLTAHKRIIDAVLKRAITVKVHSDRSCTVVLPDKNTIQFDLRNTTLFRNNSPFVSEVNNVLFRERKVGGETLFYWEISRENGEYIGGAHRFSR